MLLPVCSDALTAPFLSHLFRHLTAPFLSHLFPHLSVPLFLPLRHCCNVRAILPHTPVPLRHAVCWIHQTSLCSRLGDRYFASRAPALPSQTQRNQAFVIPSSPFFPQCHRSSSQVESSHSILVLLLTAQGGPHHLARCIC